MSDKPRWAAWECVERATNIAGSYRRDGIKPTPVAMVMQHTAAHLETALALLEEWANVNSSTDFDDWDAKRRALLEGK